MKYRRLYIALYTKKFILNDLHLMLLVMLFWSKQTLFLKPI